MNNIHQSVQFHGFLSYSAAFGLDMELVMIPHVFYLD